MKVLFDKMSQIQAERHFNSTRKKMFLKYLIQASRFLSSFCLLGHCLMVGFDPLKRIGWSHEHQPVCLAIKSE